MSRVDVADVVGAVGLGLMAAGLWALWGWPVAAVAVGVALLVLAGLLARAGRAGE